MYLETILYEIQPHLIYVLSYLKTGGNIFFMVLFEMCNNLDLFLIYFSLALQSC